MQQLMTAYVHLLATCLALGAMVLTDLRLLAKLKGCRVMIPRPQRIESCMNATALGLLVVSGATLVGMEQTTQPECLSEPALQAKLLLTGLLCALAFALHHCTFPRLTHWGNAASWSARDRLAVAVPVGLSNSLWFYAAFLGEARSAKLAWTTPDALVVAAALSVLSVGLLLLALRFMTRVEAHIDPEWLDSAKARMGIMPAPTFEAPLRRETNF